MPYELTKREKCERRCVQTVNEDEVSGATQMHVGFERERGFSGFSFHVSATSL